MRRRLSSPSGNAKHAEEYFADDNATILTVLSAAKLDVVGPAFSLAGPAFALACLEIIRRGLAIVRTGELPPDDGDSQHPPNEMRMKNVLNAFELYFEVGRDDKTGLDLTMVLRPPEWEPVNSEANQELRRRVLFWSNALLTIWDSVRPRLQKDYENKRRLHSIWQEAS